MGHRGTIGKDFEYVEILEAKGSLMAKELKRLIKVRAPYLSLDDFSDRQELTAAMPKSCRGGFLPPGLWVLEGIPKAVGDEDHKSNENVPRVVFKDDEKLVWRRPRDRDNWPKRLFGSL